jgi:hypothetical protein
MSSRRGMSGLIVALASAGLVASSGAFAISACSSSTTTNGGDPPEGGTDAGLDARKVVEAGEELDSAKQTPEQCEAECKVKHPAGVKEDAIDKCWADNCEAPCLDQSGGFDAGPDASDVDAGGLLCGTDVSSGVDENCDKCTEAFCCTSWKGCFDDPECLAYDQCIGVCNE